MTSRARSVLLAAALLLALSGCMKVDADLKVNSDETVSGSMLMAIDKNLATQFGQSPDAFREQIEKSIKQSAQEGVDCKPYDEGDYIGSTCTLDKVPFSEMGGSNGGLSFEKSGDQFVVTGGLGETGVTLPPATTGKPEIKFKITMPGKIVEHDDGAEVNGRSVTYTDAAKLAQIRIVSESGGGFPAWLIILLVVLLLGAAGAVAFVVLKARNKPVPGLPGQQYPGAPWGQPGQSGPFGPQQGQPWGPPGQQDPGQPGPQYPGQQGQPGPQYPGQPYPGQQGQQGQPGPQVQQPWGQPGHTQPQGTPPQQPWGQPGEPYPGQGSAGQHPSQPRPVQQPPQPGRQEPQDQNPPGPSPYNGPQGQQGPGPGKPGDA